MSQRKHTAVFPGRFDPVTLGHVDIIRRAVTIFDEVIVGVGDNPGKPSLLPRDRRVALLREVTADLPAVRVDPYDGLTVDFVRAAGAAVIVRGVRGAADLGYELQMAAANRSAAAVETVFIMPSPEYAFVSSSLVRQVAGLGGDVSGMVPAAVAAVLRQPGPGA